MVLLGPTIQSSSSPGASFQMAAHIMYLLKDCYPQNNLNPHCLEPLACKCLDHRYAKLFLELLAHHFIKYARIRVLELTRILPYSARIREKMDQKNSEHTQCTCVRWHIKINTSKLTSKLKH